VAALLHQFIKASNMKTATYKIKGITPMMMHSERLANPFDSLTREIKAVTGKRKKTEDDLLEIARLEWLGGLYHDDEAGIHVPGYNILACVINGGKLHKLGTAVKRAAIVTDDKVGIQYDGPKDPAKLFADKRFVDIRSVKVGTSKVARCRPIFKTWALEFNVAYDESAIQKSELDMCVRSAGLMVGLGDYRPRFGRFEVLA
jgi:hypothetical protein